MNNTGFFFTPEVVSEMALAYAEGEVIPNYWLGWVSPAGQMYSSTAGKESLYGHNV